MRSQTHNPQSTGFILLSQPGGNNTAFDELLPTRLELIAGGCVFFILLSLLWVSFLWAYRAIPKLYKSAIESVESCKCFLLSSPSDLPDVLATNAHHTFQVTPITPPQVSVCIGFNGTLLKNVRTFSDITEMGEVHHLARSVMEREMKGWARCELVGWNQWMEGGYLGGSSTIVVKVQAEGWGGILCRGIVPGCE